jgi:hypothetical protein
MASARSREVAVVAPAAAISPATGISMVLRERKPPASIAKHAKVVLEHMEMLSPRRSQRILDRLITATSPEETSIPVAVCTAEVRDVANALSQRRAVRRYNEEVAQHNQKAHTVRAQMRSGAQRAQRRADVAERAFGANLPAITPIKRDNLGFRLG